MVFFTPRKISWKFHVDILIRSVSRRGVLGGHWGFPTKDIEDMVVPDVILLIKQKTEINIEQRDYQNKTYESSIQYDDMLVKIPYDMI